MKTKVQILHTADLHLGTEFSTFSNADVRQILQDEHPRILQELSGIVKQNAVDIVLVAGDLFDKPTVPARLLQRVKDAFANLAPAYVHICAGNHDPYLEGSFWETKWPSNVHIVPANVLETYYYVDLGVRITSSSFSDLYINEPLFKTEIERQYVNSRTLNESETNDDAIEILMLHGDWNTEIGHSHYNPIPLDSVRGKGFDYVALGHIHLASSGELGFRDGRFAYPGAPQGRGFDELGLGKFLLGTFERENSKSSALLAPRVKQTWKNIYLHTRPFLIHSIDISEASTESEVQILIEEGLKQWQKELDLEDKKIVLKQAILRIILLGSPDLHYEIDLSHHADLLQRNAYFYVELEDETKARVDLERLASISGFGQILVQEVQNRKDAAKDEEERNRINRALDLIMKAHERNANEA